MTTDPASKTRWYPTPETPLDTQIGGRHYAESTLQPLEACYKRYGFAGVRAAIHTKVDKYIQRDKEGVDKTEDYEKARHTLALLIYFYNRSQNGE